MISQSEQLRHFRSNYLNLIILPTEACNFRCTYCYETFENKKMPRSVVSGIKSLIDRRGEELDELEISWFGGEPLLALDVITEISKHALGVAKTEGEVHVPLRYDHQWLFPRSGSLLAMS